ncbi:hypothetical protein niasHT_011554 [Heterodera trifolii]|uniref:Uncharacterized protein n=1 Tax=Heterodera trifolii TaxID=157864 RepID=A0ABD2L7T3_9BILA
MISSSKFCTNFDQLFNHLRLLCSNDAGATHYGTELMPIIKENPYFGALCSVMAEEKQKIRPMAAEISCAAMALAFSLDSPTDGAAKDKNCAVDQTLSECKKYYLEENELDGETKDKMKQTLEEHEQFGQLIEQANQCF